MISHLKAFSLKLVLCRAGDKSKVAIPMEHPPPKPMAKKAPKRALRAPFGMVFAIGFGGVFHGYGDFALISRSAQ